MKTTTFDKNIKCPMHNDKCLKQILNNETRLISSRMPTRVTNMIPLTLSNNNYIHKFYDN